MKIFISAALLFYMFLLSGCFYTHHISDNDSQCQHLKRACDATRYQEWMDHDGKVKCSCEATGGVYP